jgi:pimeloyl-ACP methyl ester carboxylesterase
VRQGLKKCRAGGDGPTHFITHSLGGILVRYYLRFFKLPGIGRVVMLGPPNRGSEVADELADWKLYQWINGPAGQQLVTTPDGLIAQLGPVDFPLGVITGNRHAFFDTWLADLIPGENDGKVSVARAQVSGMRDFLVLPYSHSFIMQEPEAIRQALYFLAHGRFDRTQEKQSD